jgi:hypothetical protein
MLLATAVATCALKEEVSIEEARGIIQQILYSIPSPPAELKVLLLISRDVEESLAVAQQRDPAPWSARYLRYQRILHEVLARQVDEAVYDLVIEWGSRSRSEVHQDVLNAADGALNGKS